MNSKITPKNDVIGYVPGTEDHNCGHCHGRSPIDFDYYVSKIDTGTEAITALSRDIDEATTAGVSLADYEGSEKSTARRAAYVPRLEVLYTMKILHILKRHQETLNTPKNSVIMPLFIGTLAITSQIRFYLCAAEL